MSGKYFFRSHFLDHLGFIPRYLLGKFLSMDVSVVIPVFNEEKFIKTCYQSLVCFLKGAELTYEIIIIDNGSEDRTPELLKDFEEALVYRISRTSISCARNFGVSKSKGDVLAFIDGDVVVNMRWVQMLSHFVKNGIENFLTGYEYLVRESPSWIEKYWFSNLASDHINAGNLIISRSAFDDLGGFDEALKTGEDYDLCSRARQLRYIDYCPVDAFEAVHLGYPSTLSGFIKREMWHGEGDFSSVKVFLSSKVALLSLFYILIQIFAISFILTGFYLSGIFSLGFLYLLNMAITILRFRGRPMKTLLVNSVINYLYFVARFASFFQSLAKKGSKF
jgi:glycosyltransferase involved in cell wall biosynthesis